MGALLHPVIDVVTPCRGFVDRPGMTRALGGTFARADATTCATTLSKAGIFATVAANVERSSDWLWDNGRNLGGMTLLEAACTNSALGSSDFSITTYWTNVGTNTLAAATSCIAGQVATLHTGSAASNNSRRQAIGTFVNGQTDCAYAIYEQGTCTTSSVEIFDSTASAVAAQAIYTWATDTVTTAGTPAGSGRIILATTGPNGGKLVLVWVTFTGTASGTGNNGNTRSAFLFPMHTSGSLTCVLHHGQFQAATDVPMSPIVTVASTVTRAADALDFPFAPTAAQLAGTGVSIYEDYVITEKAIISGCLIIGSNDIGGANCLTVIRDGTIPNFGARVRSGGASKSVCTFDMVFSLGDRIERLTTVTTGGAATLTIAVNGGTPTVGTTGTAGGWPAAFDAAKISLVDEATAARKGGVSRRPVLVLPGAVGGQPGLDRMRRLALSGQMGDGSLLLGGWFQ